MKRIAELYGATKDSAETFAESNLEFESKLAAVSGLIRTEMSYIMSGPIRRWDTVAFQQGGSFCSF